MIKVCIQRNAFPAADVLADIFGKRMAPISWREAVAPSADAAPSSKESAAEVADVFVCSAAFAAMEGDMAKLVDIGRTLRAKKIMIFDAAADQAFCVSSEMNGRIIRVTAEAGDPTGPSMNFGLQMLATLALDKQHVAVAEPESTQLMALANRVAQTDVTVFINGPTGTGKEVLARYIHNRSSRYDNPFVAVNCAAIPENMLEAILFGHEKGAFTGASTANKGIFRAADGGTLLLDEISEMPLSLQAKLLRALQEKKVTPIGSQREIDVDVRVLATTNRDMLQDVREGKFREDLFYRLNVFPLTTKPLANRPADIVPISTILLARHAATVDDLPLIDAEAQALLLSYKWPGNVRELENVLQRALVLMSGGQITQSDIMVDGSFGPGQTTITSTGVYSAASATA